jgi:hypothetical protein
MLATRSMHLERAFVSHVMFLFSWYCYELCMLSSLLAAGRGALMLTAKPFDAIRNPRTSNTHVSLCQVEIRIILLCCELETRHRRGGRLLTRMDPTFADSMETDTPTCGLRQRALAELPLMCVKTEAMHFIVLGCGQGA